MLGSLALVLLVPAFVPALHVPALHVSVSHVASHVASHLSVSHVLPALPVLPRLPVSVLPATSMPSAVLSASAARSAPSARARAAVPSARLASGHSADEVTERYTAACAKKDAARLAELWRTQRGRVLVTIDADLEASLAEWEKGEARDAERIEELEQRALWAAGVASETLGAPIFHDYAASFVGWDDAQKRSFRAGQQAHGRARVTLKEGDAEAALAAARECAERALLLGDWWGTAMGLGAEASALAALDRHEEALAAAARSRLLYAQLGLQRAELAQVRTMVTALVALERTPRARAAAEAGARLARELGDEETAKALERAAGG